MLAATAGIWVFIGSIGMAAKSTFSGNLRATGQEGLAMVLFFWRQMLIEDKLHRFL